MTRLHEPIQYHIHQELCDEMNEMSIRIKLHHLIGQNAHDFEAVEKAKALKPKPTWAEIENLIMRSCVEMLKCTKPFKYH